MLRFRAVGQRQDPRQAGPAHRADVAAEEPHDLGLPGLHDHQRGRDERRRPRSARAPTSRRALRDEEASRRRRPATTSTPNQPLIDQAGRSWIVDAGSRVPDRCRLGLAVGLDGLAHGSSHWLCAQDKKCYRSDITLRKGVQTAATTATRLTRRRRPHDAHLRCLYRARRAAAARRRRGGPGVGRPRRDGHPDVARPRCDRRLFRRRCRGDAGPRRSVDPPGFGTPRRLTPTATTRSSSW